MGKLFTAQVPDITALCTSICQLWRHFVPQMKTANKTKQQNIPACHVGLDLHPLPPTPPPLPSQHTTPQTTHTHILYALVRYHLMQKYTGNTTKIIILNGERHVSFKHRHSPQCRLVRFIEGFSFCKQKHELFSCSPLIIDTVSPHELPAVRFKSEILLLKST